MFGHAQSEINPCLIKHDLTQTHTLPTRLPARLLPEMECISTYSRHCEQQKLGMQQVTGVFTQLATLKLVVST